VRIDYRWGAGDANRFRQYASELLALSPDVILASGSPVVPALQAASRTVPIVFVQVADPVGAGFVASLARPGGNVTGFTTMEFGTSGKWLELLNKIAPGVTLVAVPRDPAIAAGSGSALKRRRLCSPAPTRWSNRTFAKRSDERRLCRGNSRLVPVRGR
jgi:putative ABC transport system substrate-binding protein